ncbi:exopolysaccharide biosynthesis protein [Rhizobium sp. 32-5/1]|uniref:exopolysaccharide biosynthesis protein n=1 Tax=Rhizobium sp. 32-5/1 TaxID=3019602 RepID=UPI00240E5682|nr:exopolysaccharide biosynthesis protein [Rhizobium sp. 32-5/1]WEZ83193.1 exopolysaccharide biosynthesis protein [Rhizobium sp. 32-5/1]
MTDTFSNGAQARAQSYGHTDRQLSHLLRNLALNSGPKVTLRDLAVAMEDRSFGAFLVVFALPNLIPCRRAPPSSSACR